MTEKVPEKNRGIISALKATKYSMQGIVHAFCQEAAFRQELIGAIILTPTAFFLPISITFKAIIAITHMVILCVELLNSAIEAVVDKASPEYHILAKNAKDMASAAVFFSLLTATIAWGCAIYSIWHP